MHNNIAMDYNGQNYMSTNEIILLSNDLPSSPLTAEINSEQIYTHQFSSNLSLDHLFTQWQEQKNKREEGTEIRAMVEGNVDINDYGNLAHKNKVIIPRN